MDYYQTLGISKAASDVEIKNAYRKKALEWHPDRNKSPEATAKFKEINEAYEILSNPQKKQSYDQFGSAGPQQNGGPFQYSYQSYGGNQNPFEGMDFGGFSDPFELFEQFHFALQFHKVLKNCLNNNACNLILLKRDSEIMHNFGLNGYRARIPNYKPD